jgi:hypothetical protein
MPLIGIPLPVLFLCSLCFLMLNAFGHNHVARASEPVRVCEGSLPVPRAGSCRAPVPGTEPVPELAAADGCATQEKRLGGLN